MTETPYDYKAASEWIKEPISDFFTIEIQDAIQRALLIADRIQQEPSNGMISATQCGWHFSTVFKAMAAQMVKEIDAELGE